MRPRRASPAATGAVGGNGSARRRVTGAPATTRLGAWLAGTEGPVALAFLVGLCAGAGAVGFRYLILGLTELFTGHSDYSVAGHAANPHLPARREPNV